MNAILEKILNDRKGHYVHALELHNVHELKTCIEQLAEELQSFGKDVFSEFILSMQLYCLDDKNEDEIFNFDIQSFIDDLNW